MNPLANRITVVIITHNRAYELLRTLKNMYELPEKPPIVVVDNASIDDTKLLVKEKFPQITLVSLKENLGGAGRNIGARQAQTPYVAFCDDDTWWEPGDLLRAADLLDAYPKIALLSANILVGAEDKQDPICALMAHSPLQSEDLPGRSILGFLAGAVVVRRNVFLEAGGFEENFFIGGEEELLAFDLAARGWIMLYAPHLIVHHYPSAQRNPAFRKKIMARNAIWVAWMRLPWGSAVKQTFKVLYLSYRRHILLTTLLNVLRGLPWALRNRRVIPLNVESMYRQIQH
jgi:GT2 family glycosyltransferase